MQFECGGQLFEQLVDDSRGGNVRRYHSQETVTSVFGLRIRHVLHSRLGHPEKRFPYQQAITVGARAGAEPHYVGKQDRAVLAVQWL
jgi:hypothetical protein